LGFDSLCSVDHEQTSFHRRKRTGNFVLKIDVPRSVYHVEFVSFPVHANGREFDRDSSFLFEIHGVECLGTKIAFFDGSGNLQKPIGKRRFSVIDMGDDAEVFNIFL